MTVPPQFRVLAVAAGWFVPFLLAQKPSLPAVQEVQGALGGELQGIFTLNGTAQGQRVSPTYISGDSTATAGPIWPPWSPYRQEG